MMTFCSLENVELSVCLATLSKFMGVNVTIDDLIDLQDAGAKARELGLQTHDNPFLQAGRTPPEESGLLSEWLSKHDAWKFGWEAENASLEGQISQHFRALIESGDR
jgi:hypothetical protein